MMMMIMMIHDVISFYDYDDCLNVAIIWDKRKSKMKDRRISFMYKMEAIMKNNNRKKDKKTRRKD